MSGTTVDATRSPNDPFATCARTGSSVFYRLGPVAPGPVALRLQASGRLDAALVVFRQVRSELRPVACDPTDDDGLGQVRITAERGAEYLVMVAERSGSDAGTFSLQSFVPEAPEGPPGRPLPGAGASAAVDAVVDPGDAWSVRMREGQGYRIALTSGGASRGCVQASLYAAGTRDFASAEPLLSLSCSEYRLFTPGPGEGGRLSFLVAPDGSRPGSRPYRLRVAPAGPDDTTPGRPLDNLSTASGSVNFQAADVVDLYRFDVVRRSDLSLRLSVPSGAGVDLVLLNDRGRTLRCQCDQDGGTALRERLRPGRYYAAVRARPGARGRYRLTRLTRTITSTSVSIGGSRNAQAAPGAAVTLGARVSPAPGGGVVEITVQRLDPLEGWQFLRRLRVGVGGGTGSVSFVPPSLGRYRVRAEFPGTRTASPSRSGTARLLVAGPLTP